MRQFSQGPSWPLAPEGQTGGAGSVRQARERAKASVQERDTTSAGQEPGSQWKSPTQLDAIPLPSPAVARARVRAAERLREQAGDPNQESREAAPVMGGQYVGRSNSPAKAMRQAPSAPRHYMTQNNHVSAMSGELVSHPPDSHASRADALEDLATSLKFPQAPSHAAGATKRSREAAPPSSRRPGEAYRNHPPYVSPIAEEGAFRQSPSTPSPRLVTANRKKYESAYDDESVYSRTDDTVHDDTGIVRQASLGRKAKPAMTNIKSWGDHPSPAGSDRATPPRFSTINSLSAAIAAGMSVGTHQPDAPDTRPTAAHQRSVRMPFDSSPPVSPTSVEISLEPPALFETRPRSPLPTPRSGNSTMSSRPLLGAGFEQKPGMSDKVPTSRRPPRLNIEAVREAESRGSTTSLTDLIKRATKLATNLDRGKTASRLGMLDMFNEGGAAEKRAQMKRRGSGLSEMLSAFPPPASTPTSLQHPGGHAQTARSPSNLQHMKGLSSDSQNDGKKRKGRRCCGMSLPWFLVVLFILLLLIAAAVIVPLFLILIIPSEHKKAGPDLSTCPSTFVCQNDGISTINGNACGCICVGGFTGDHCTLAASPDCVNAQLSEGSFNYGDVTVGNNLPGLFRASAVNFSIPLNTTQLLALFSSNNLSCTTENALVSFNVRATKSKRLYILPVPLPTRVPRHMARDMYVRQNPSTVASTNGIVFQASSTTEAVAAATATATTAPGSASATSTSLSISPAPTDISTTPAVTASANTLSFASLVVLYVLQQSNTLSVAVNAQQILQNYLLAGNTNGTIEVGYGALNLTADFGRLEIFDTKGKVAGAAGRGS